MHPIPRRRPASSRITDPKDTVVKTRGENPGDLPGDLPGGHRAGCTFNICCCGGGATATPSGPQGGAQTEVGQSSSVDAFPFAELRGKTGYLIVRLKAGLLPRIDLDPGKQPSDATLVEFAKKKSLGGLHRALLRTEVIDDLCDLCDDSSDDAEQVVEETVDPYVASRPLVFNRHMCEYVDPQGVTVLPAASLYYRIRCLESPVHQSDFVVRHSLLSYWRVDCRAYPEEMAPIYERLKVLPEVDLVYYELPALDPSLVTGNTPGALYGEEQSYLDAAPVGIGARWARTRLPNAGSKVRLLDLEQQWVLNHRDLVRRTPGQATGSGNSSGTDDGLTTAALDNGEPVPGPLFGDNLYQGVLSNGADGHHGTAVLALLAGGLHGPNETGVRGIADLAAELAVTSHYVEQGPHHEVVGSNGHVAEAIANALSGSSDPLRRPLGRCDVLLLEVQRAYLPTEADAADFDAIRLATSAGVLVVEAAGNGGLNLDAYVNETGRYMFDRGATDFVDTGAVMVGAADSALPHDRASFSNYGSRVDCYGWGSNVTTAGYGDYVADLDPTKIYTNTFKGTSSAAPCVAGAAVLLQYLFHHNLKDEESLAPTQPVALTPWRLRQLLADPATGTPQGTGVAGHIGVMPNLQAIAEHSGVGFIPQIYMRRGLDHECHAVCTSPDVFMYNGRLPSATTLDAPEPLRDSADHLCVRVRNRGLGHAAAEKLSARLFVGPPATLLMPALWREVGLIAGRPGQDAEQGDLPVWMQTLAVPELPPGVGSSPSIMAQVAYKDSDEPDEPDEPDDTDDPGLFSAASCVDWSTFVASLDDEQMACRNVHWLSANVTPAEADFWITGATDSERTFDLEILQRLPAKARTTLELPVALAARLRQLQSWTAAPVSTLPQQLILPATPKILLSGVLLRHGAAHRAKLHIASSGLRQGHSLAIRQLWRGREVGRITWRFVV